MSDQNQILRLLATLREEMAAVRGRQEELYELLVSYKDQIHELKSTVTEKLQGLPSSPYIAGQLVPAPEHIGGVDDFRQLLATYLHGPTPKDVEDGPVDVDMSPPPAVKPEDIELEPSDDPPRRRRHSERIDPDLSRGPDRDVVPLDLDEPKKKKRRRSRSRTKKKAAKGGD